MRSSYGERLHILQGDAETGNLVLNSVIERVVFINRDPSLPTTMVQQDLPIGTHSPQRLASFPTRDKCNKYICHMKILRRVTLPTFALTSSHLLQKQYPCIRWFNDLRVSDRRSFMLMEDQGQSRCWPQEIDEIDMREVFVDSCCRINVRRSGSKLF